MGKITIDKDDAAALTYGMTDVITLCKRRTINGEIYILLPESHVTSILGLLYALVKGSEVQE